MSEGPSAAREGTIAALHTTDGTGTIRADDGGAMYHFAADDVQGAEFAALRVGQAVTFEPDPDARDPERRLAVAVRPANAVSGD